MKCFGIMIITILMLLIFVQEVSAAKIINIELLIFKNDTVGGSTINVTEGRYSQYSEGRGEYVLDFVDANGESIDQQRFDVSFHYGEKSFDAYLLSYKEPYNSDIKSIILYHFNKVIFSKDVACVDCPVQNDNTNQTLEQLWILALSIAGILITSFAVLFYRKRKKEEAIKIRELE